MGKKDMQTLVAHLKSSGFVFASSEIYGGLANAWDYGPLGAELKNNILIAWKREFVDSQPNVFYFDSKIFMNSKVWEASGHVDTFTDILIENKTNGKRYRIDHLITAFDNKNSDVEQWSLEQQHDFVVENIKKWEGVNCEWTKPRHFNLMFETAQGVVVDDKSKIYLRPETAQGIFVNFKNVQRSMRLKLPFGISQVGKAFRNEVTPRNFIFRTREFEQMEIEYFVKPEEANEAYKKYMDQVWKFALSVGLSAKNMKHHHHKGAELSHYSTATCDINYNFPFGWSELLGISNRTDFDLRNHEKHSKQDLKYLDSITNKKFWPYVIEPSIGLDRLMLAILCEAYDEEKIDDKNTRIVMRFKSNIAPYQVAVLPLVKKLGDKSLEVFHKLLSRKDIKVLHDITGSIGKRYRRQDAIGTPYCVTIDYDTLKDDSVTIRDRDSMKQKRVKIANIIKELTFDN